MPTTSKITVGETEYNLRDADAQEQLTQLKSDLSAAETDIRFINYVEQGSINSDGTESNNTARLRTDFIPISGCTKVKVELPSQYWFSYTFYSNILLNTFVSQSPTWITEPSEISIPVTANYIRIVVRLADNGAISSLPVDTLKVYFYFTLSGRINANVGSDSHVFMTINHKGMNYSAPENTLPAFALSSKNGFKYVETDVSFTSDNVAVLMHDDTINRTARNLDGSELSEPVAIRSITYQQALGYDYGIWKGAKFAGTKIPTFYEFLDFCKKTSLRPCIELKNNFTVDNTKSVADTIRQLGMVNDVMFISYTYTYLQRMAAEIPNASYGLSISAYTQEDVETRIQNVSTLKTEDNMVFVIGSLSSMTEALYQIVKNANMPLMQWIVNKSNQVPTLQSNCFGALTDHLNVSKVMQNYYVKDTLN